MAKKSSAHTHRIGQFLLRHFPEPPVMCYIQAKLTDHFIIRQQQTSPPIYILNKILAKFD
jgi:hypothetical protein